MNLNKFAKTTTAKDIMKLKKLAMEMDMEIISIMIPQKYLNREFLEPTYPEKFMGMYVCEHKEMLTPKFLINLK